MAIRCIIDHRKGKIWWSIFARNPNVRRLRLDHQDEDIQGLKDPRTNWSYVG